MSNIPDGWRLTYERDTLLLRTILDRPDGDILNIVQLAHEHKGTLYTRLSKAYHEVAGNDGNPDEVIGLK